MSEPTITLGYTDFQTEIGMHLRYGPTYSSWSAAQLAEVDRIIQSAVRKVLFPQFVPPGERNPQSYRWSFLSPSDTMETGTKYTFTSALATDVFTCAGHPFSNGDQVMLYPASGASLSTGVNAYTVYYVVNNVAATSFKLSLTSGGSAINLTTDSSGTCQVREYTSAYDLPDDFGGIVGGSLFYDVSEDQGDLKIDVRAEADVQRLLSQDDQRGKPRVAATRAKSQDMTTSARYEIIFWPIPDDAYTLVYRYNALPNKISASYPYPLGGPQLSEVYLASCIAVASFRRDDEAGMYEQDFQQKLAAAISQDRQIRSPENLGYNGDYSEDNVEHRKNIYVTYEDTLY